MKNHKNYLEHPEASEYGGCEYTVDGKKIIERTSKTTPKKIGQFVTLWKRNSDGVTCPYDYSDKFDYVSIKCVFENRSGEFNFSKTALLENGIISRNGKGGKRGFRLYPVWDKPTSKQALKTQSWQLEYFKEL